MTFGACALALPASCGPTEPAAVSEPNASAESTHEAPPEAAPARPNVVLLLADDLGWGDTGYNGHPVLRTPNLDQLAADGLRFDRFYAASPVCSPTRASILTGRHGIRQGLPVANGGHLRAEELTLAEALRDAGYTTGHFGKWHIGTIAPGYTIRPDRLDPVTDHTTPGDNGFDEWFSTESSVATWDPYDKANPPRSFAGMGLEWDRRAFYWHNGELVDEDLEGDDSRIIMDRVLPFIDGAVEEGTPFCAVVWFHAPHIPVIAGPEYLAMYPDQSEGEQHYFGVVSALDEQVGRLRAHLAEAGVADNTVVWFFSDNGPEGMPGPEERTQGSAGPFRGRKRSLYEGGVRVPGALVWPGVVEPGRTTDTPAVSSDVLPTLVTMTSAGRLPDLPYDGVDITPLIRGDAFERPGPIAFGFQDRSAIIGPRYKLVVNASPRRHPSDNGTVPVQRLELYDLIEDPSETNNVVADHADLGQAMWGDLRAWLASCAASDRGEDYPEPAEHSPPATEP
ncbi:MAG: N-acetylgalactosamine-6-sulfatase [Phycisphaeraceae bacterium]|nr:MAG: N-acetylgalactosamine-6-sulfatase [Phycisphaeraceae bacterium]